jgi:uncharacterized protein (TIGR02145 family)
LPPNSSGTWSCGTQIWSGALRNPAGCTSTSSLSTSRTPPAQYRDYSTSYGYYYNWTCVNNYASTLCPSPLWRVPTWSDLTTLVSCVGGNNATGGGTMSSAWGHPGYAGYPSGNSITNEGSVGYVWSATASGDRAYYLLYTSNQLQGGPTDLFYGFHVRCVRDL